MEINVEELQKILEKVRPGLASKEQIEQSTSFAFADGKVFTYNGEVGVSHPIEGLEFEGAVEADALYNFLSKLTSAKAESISAVITEHEILFTHKRIKAGLALQMEIKLPLHKKGNKDWADLPKDFIKHIGFAMAACSNNAATAIYTFVHVNRVGIIEGTDGYRIIQCQLSDELPVKSFLLPATTAEILVKMNPVQISEGKGYMHFKTEEETIISCKISNEPFLNVAPIIPKQGKQIILPRTIDKLLDRAMVFAKREHVYDETVNIIIENNRFQIQAKCKAGWFKEDVNIPYDEETIEFDIAPYLLKGILMETRGCFISKNKLKFEGQNWLYIASLKA